MMDNYIGTSGDTAVISNYYLRNIPNAGCALPRYKKSDMDNPYLKN